MKKIALITDGWGRYVTYTWIQGYRNYMAAHRSDMDLYIFQSFGNFSMDEKHNTGEYNITRLPDFSEFDGILLDLATVSQPDLIAEVIERARKSGVPTVSLLEQIPGFYHSGIDNYEAITRIVDHLITEHGCRTLNYIGGPEFNKENQLRFKAYKDALLRHGIPFEGQRVIHHNYEIETGIQAFSIFKEKDLLPDAFVCVNDNTAVGVCLAAKEAGYSIPGDFLVTGFDNEDKASYYDPRITTVGFSKADVMADALLLLEKIWQGKAETTYVYAPFNYVFQESCGCISQNPPDRGEYVIGRIVAEARQSDMQNWMMDLNRVLLDCSGYTELAGRMQTWLTEHGCGNIYLFMNPDIFMSENVDVLPEIPDDAYLTHGYPNEMTLVYPRQENQKPQQLDLKEILALPRKESDGKQNIYQFCPLHFREREIGFLIITNCDYLLEHQFLFETLNALQTSMEALYARLTLRKMNKQLSQLYIHDSLTGLYNRMAYEKLALPLFHQCMQENQPVGIMFVDADHLKYINDNFGHDMGNLAISSIASVLRQYCPAESISMRYGGDEFVCVIPYSDKRQMQELAHTLQASLDVLSANSQMGFPIEASIGWVIAEDPVLTLNDYINLADEKMYSAKKARKAERKDS
ncbi:diguanylate cyclase [Blautia sp. Sow4_E7]|uniref:diguanylate cyclase n=1 Tax=Blautia sp. Sow4_E7 TaxID=3438749 RepID=UPI003F90220E